MTVKELIAELQKLDSEQIVVVAGQEGGFDEVVGASEIQLRLNVNTEPWYGKHEQVNDGGCRAVCIDQPLR